MPSVTKAPRPCRSAAIKSNFLPKTRHWKSWEGKISSRFGKANCKCADGCAKDDRKNFEDLTDDDYRPNIVQKGVDMRIGLDMAILAERRLIDRLILITRDTDMIPAMKHCRTQAIQIVLFVFRKKGASYEMRQHSDIVREADENWRQGLASIGADGD